MILRDMEWIVCGCLLATLTAVVSASIGVVVPNDPYIYIGNNLTLSCNLTRYDADYDSRFLMFTRKDDEVIPRQYINITSTRSIKLMYPITSPEDGGRYMCRINRTAGRPEIVGSQLVVVEYEPKVVEEVDCRVYNWENMTCTWDLQRQYVHPENIDIDLIWTVGSDTKQYECRHQTATSCSWRQVDDTDSFRSDMLYIMGVSIYNERTKKYYNQPRTSKIHTSRIVEPAPVIDLGANASSTCITIRWSHSQFRRDKVYRVKFKKEWETSWNVKHVGDMETFTQCDLDPHTVYHFNVVCRPRFRDEVNGFWSQPASIAMETKEDVPTQAPEVQPGSYVEHPCQQNFCKKVMVYWKPIGMQEANGEILKYQLSYGKVSKGSGEQEERDVYKTQGNTFEATLLLVAGDNYVIYLTGATGVGFSNVSSRILIPPRGQKPDVPELVVEAHNMSEKTHITLSWDVPRVWTSKYWRNLTSFTVFWCKGFKISQSCSNSIQWQELSMNQTSLELPISVREDGFENYLFGVAVNAVTQSGEIISSGMKWNSCTYVINWRPEKAPANLRFADMQPNKGLSVEWDKLSCSDSPAYIQNYLVTACPSQDAINCTGSIMTFTVDNKISSLTMTDLKHGVQYKVWVNAVSRAGLSPDSEALYGVVIDKSLTTGEISGIVVGALFVLIIFLFSIILCTKRVVRTIKKRFEPVPIEVPHTLPPLPPIPMPPQKLSPDSTCSSEGIYASIDGPPSPSSSVDSSAGAEAPLIHSKWKISTIKHQIYGKKKEQRDSNDSGRGSLSHSAETLLTRLHPSHIRKLKERKQKTRNQSDSGVIVDSSGQPSCSYTSSGQCRSEPDTSSRTPVPGGEVNPYSCVNIVDDISVNTNSEKLFRKLSPCNSGGDGGDRSGGSTDKSYNTGSTISLPPVPSFLLQTLPTRTLNLRTKSADNELDYDERKLASMKETGELDSSDVYSEAEDGNQDDVYCGHQTSGSSSESREPNVKSYIRVGNGYVTEMNATDTASRPGDSELGCDCMCRLNGAPVMVDGYVKQEVFANGHVCGCNKGKPDTQQDGLRPPDMLQVGLRPVSQVMNLPPHFFGSLSTVPVDPATTTEL